MILTILVTVAVIWLSLVLSFVALALIEGRRQDRRNEPRVWREAREAANVR